MPIRHRGRKGAILLTVAVIGAVLWISSRPPIGPQPIAELPGLRRVAAEDWPEFAIWNPPEEPGWVAVPTASDVQPFRSHKDPAHEGFLPPGECLDCHREITTGFLTTAHARTTTEPTSESILGSFDPPHNRVDTSVEGFCFEMIHRGSSFLQQLQVHRDGIEYVADVPIDLVVGSGNHGQSYLHWNGDRLCQLPVSYYSEFDRWTNAPGTYRDGTADFARPATSRCMDCHNTWLGHAAGTVNRFERSRAILGVTCVRCHGPAREHVEHHRANSADRDPVAIINPRNLDRDRANETCAQCHSGGGELLRPAFSYIPGQPLNRYIELDLSGEGEQNDDPHSANQLGRLARSKCYQASQSLTCFDCHDPHRHERGQTPTFSQRCQQCHTPADCPEREPLGSGIETRCVECHMPSRRDAHVAAQSGGEVLLPLLRDHLIGIWPEASQRVADEMRRESSAVPTDP